ncbi:MAG TPA: hydroxymethylbilane synthase [Actinomycetes bacterium]
MSAAALRLGTRRSPLALAQSRLVAAALERRGAGSVALVEIATLGDVSREPLTQLGGTGVFVSALRDALLAGEVDLAVHSLKDLPVAPADGLLLAAISTREDPRDALVARDGLSLAGLPDGARIGTGSPRRAAQLRALGRDFDVVPVRGNVGTRIGHATSGEVDAVVLALAGLARLGRLDAVTEVLAADVMLPAPGQGALAVECRSDRADVVAALAPLDDPATRAAVTAERALLARTEAGCSAPVGALAEVEAAQIHLRGVVGSTDGSVRRLSITGPLADPVGLGFQLADRLLDEGAEGLWGVRVR